MKAIGDNYQSVYSLMGMWVKVYSRFTLLLLVTREVLQHTTNLGEIPGEVPRSW